MRPRLRRRTLALLLGAIAIYGVASPGFAQRGNPRMEFAGQSIDAMIADFMAEHSVPGMAVAIVQAPYIPRVTGYGLADTGKKLLVGSNTLFDVGEMANAYVAVALMQLVEAGKLGLADPIGKYVPDLPETWRAITLRDLLSHSSGLPDFESDASYDPSRDYQPETLISLIGAKSLAFKPGTAVTHSATDYVLLARAIEAASGQRLRDFVRERQFEALGLRHTVFSDELNRVKSEPVELNENRHKHFLAESVFINPTERATGYRDDGALTPVLPARPSGKFGYGAILASTMDISIWDIGLAGGVLVKDPALRAILYNPAKLADGRTVPVMGDWRFPGRKGLMYIAGNDNGHSAFLSRFTDASELVCVTLLANKDSLDLTQLGRKVAGAYDPRLAPPSEKGLHAQQSPYSVAETAERFRAVLGRGSSLTLASTAAAEAADKTATIRVTAAPDTPVDVRVWDDSGQVWIGYTDGAVNKSTADAGSLRDHLDRTLLQVVTPY
jgi:CubicO group peptidase (beta-lactamase class C family)